MGILAAPTGFTDRPPVTPLIPITRSVLPTSLGHTTLPSRQKVVRSGRLRGFFLCDSPFHPFPDLGLPQIHLMDRHHVPLDSLHNLIFAGRFCFEIACQIKIPASECLHGSSPGLHKEADAIKRYLLFPTVSKRPVDIDVSIETGLPCMALPAEY